MPNGRRFRGFRPPGQTASALVAIFLPLAACSPSSPPLSAASSAAPGRPAGTAAVERGVFVRTLRITGLVEPTRSYTVMTPRLAGPGMSSLVITRLVRSGSQVKKGNLLVEFDRQAQLRNALDRRSEFLDFEAQIGKKQAEQQAARVADETELAQAENAVERARLELLKNEMLSAIAAEKNEQAFEEAKARLQALRETFDLKRRAAAAEIRILEIQRDRARAAMLKAQENAEKMAIASPLDGLVVAMQVFKGSQMGEVQEGEEVRAGVPVLQVVNSSAMQVRVKVNQLDAQALSMGQPATIRLDAYPEKSFPGRVEQVSPIALTSDMSPKVRTFTAVVSITATDPVLLPDLTAAIDVETERLPNVLLLPRDAVTRTAQGWMTRVIGGSARGDRLVTLGAVSDQHVVITGGVEEGTTVARGAGQEGSGR